MIGLSVTELTFDVDITKLNILKVLAFGVSVLQINILKVKKMGIFDEIKNQVNLDDMTQNLQGVQDNIAQNVSDTVKNQVSNLAGEDMAQSVGENVNQAMKGGMSQMMGNLGINNSSESTPEENSPT